MPTQSSKGYSSNFVTITCVQSESMEFVGHHFDQELGARNARSLDMTRCKVWICISLAVSESEHSVLQSGGVWSSPEVDNDTEN